MSRRPTCPRRRFATSNAPITSSTITTAPYRSGWVNASIFQPKISGGGTLPGCNRPPVYTSFDNTMVDSTRLRAKVVTARLTPLTRKAGNDTTIPTGMVKSIPTAIASRNGIDHRSAA